MNKSNINKQKPVPTYGGLTRGEVWKRNAKQSLVTLALGAAVLKGATELSTLHERSDQAPLKMPSASQEHKSFRIGDVVTRKIDGQDQEVKINTISDLAHFAFPDHNQESVVDFLKGQVSVPVTELQPGTEFILPVDSAVGSLVDPAQK